jgi:energy-coupling factor transporter ATP-binding protein EcfA2
MKILSLQAENIKRLVAVEIRPDGALIQITGRNGAGKTSVLDSIWWALDGAKNIQVSPIRAGAKTAHVRLDLGEVIVTRKFRRQGDELFTTTLTVENADGARFGEPQKMLNSLIGALSFDPLAFTRLDPKNQLEALKGLVPGVDWKATETANEKDRAKRTEINREVASLRARADAINVPGDAPSAIDTDALIAKLDDAAQHNAEIERRKSDHDRLRSSHAQLTTVIEQRRKRIGELHEEIGRLEAAIETETAGARGINERLNSLPQPANPIDTAEVRRQLQDAKAINVAAASAAEKKRLSEQALAEEVKSGHLTKAIKDRAEAVAAAIASAELPVQGLGFGDGYVTLNGLPFAQASDAEQLRTSIALAMAMNPKLKVLRIRDGSLLDENGLRLVAEMAELHDFQVWVERVDTSGKIGVVIEDGSVRGAPVAEAAE